MPRLTGTVLAQGKPAEGAYVQLQNLKGDFQGEVRAFEQGRFTFHPSPGRWRLVSWLPNGESRAEREIEVAKEDLQVDIALS